MQSEEQQLRDLGLTTGEIRPVVAAGRGAEAIAGIVAWQEREAALTDGSVPGVTPYAVPEPDTALCRFCGQGIVLAPAKANPKFRVWLHRDSQEMDCSTVSPE